MIKNEIYKNLDGYQLGILEEALNHKTIDEADVNEVYINVHEHEYEAHREYGVILDDGVQENFNEVYRYLKSQEVDEEIRKQKLIEYANIEYSNIQKSIDEYIELNIRDILPEEILEYSINLEDSLSKHLGVKFGFTDAEVVKIVKFKALNLHGYDDDVKILDLVKRNNELIKSRSKTNKAYELLNKLYNAVPESYRSKIDYGTDYEDNGNEKAGKTIFFDDIALGTIDYIKDIGCWNGKICGRNDNETTKFDKFISIDKIGSYRNIFFTYKDNGEYDSEITEELEKGKIYSRNENGQVVEVLR
ncbi:hypothetical protein [Clostridium botulinum]|uniref:hypothetical protein n=1 Tax=Clostridium botulinum TaxID=1491 RepID=UPI000773D03B|nr:hypothetical protein [Clostridium botulinum]